MSNSSIVSQLSFLSRLQKPACPSFGSSFLRQILRSECERS